MGFIALACLLAGALLVAALCELAPPIQPDEEPAMPMTTQRESDYIIHHVSRHGAHMVYHFRRDQLPEVGYTIIRQYQAGLLTYRDVNELRAALEDVQLMDPPKRKASMWDAICKGK